MIRFIFIVLIIASCNGKSNSSLNKDMPGYQVKFDNHFSDTILFDIQSKIQKAFVRSIINNDDQSLIHLKNKLEKLYANKNHKLILYWRAYLQFYLSIFYLKTGDSNKAEKAIDNGVDWMKDINNKNSEDYALLAMLEGFSIQFKGIKAMFIANEIKKNAKYAIMMDSTNIRAYYVFANNDYYTPERFGGGKEAEKFLLKAISLPVQKIKNEYLPSWGLEESYELLIRLYIRNEKWDLAKKYFSEAIQKFPESYTINQLAVKLVNK